jgi:hypothetical protein
MHLHRQLDHLTILPSPLKYKHLIQLLVLLESQCALDQNRILVLDLIRLLHLKKYPRCLLVYLGLLGVKVGIRMGMDMGMEGNRLI